MPRVVLTHAVVDIERWLEGKAERAEAIESGSGSNVTDYVAQDGSNNIAVTADISDLAAMEVPCGPSAARAGGYIAVGSRSGGGGNRTRVRSRTG